MDKHEWLEEELMAVCKWLTAAALAVALAFVGITMARAESTPLGTYNAVLGIDRYPLAYVDVNRGSCLNVRKTPGGEWAYKTLPCKADIVLLQLSEDGGWYLIAEPIEGEPIHPAGWVCAQYVRIYNDYIVDHKK